MCLSLSFNRGHQVVLPDRIPQSSHLVPAKTPSCRHAGQLGQRTRCPAQLSSLSSATSGFGSRSLPHRLHVPPRQGLAPALPVILSKILSSFGWLGMVPSLHDGDVMEMCCPPPAFSKLSLKTTLSLSLPEISYTAEVGTKLRLLPLWTIPFPGSSSAVCWIPCYKM